MVHVRLQLMEARVPTYLLTRTRALIILHLRELLYSHCLQSASYLLAVYRCNLLSDCPEQEKLGPRFNCPQLISPPRFLRKHRVIRLASNKKEHRWCK